MPRTPAPGTRDRILDNACRLFAEHGVHNVGLQQVIDETGCGKNLLYREFPSKDDLIVAYLQRCQLDWTRTVDAAIEPHAGDPGAQLVAIVSAVATKATTAGARGCALRNTYAEFPDHDHPAHRVAEEHIKSVRVLLHDLAKRTGAADPGALADRIMLILDGVYINGATLGPTGAAPSAVAFAEEVVAAATRPAAEPR